MNVQARTEKSNESLILIGVAMVLVILSACSLQTGSGKTEPPSARSTTTNAQARTEEDAMPENPWPTKDSESEADPRLVSDSIPIDDELTRMAAVNTPPQLSERELGIHVLPCEPGRVPGRDEVANKTYFCGVFTVPQNWGEPDGRNLDLSFVVARSSSENPEPDPVIFLAGGPGQSATVASPIPYQKVRQSRDIIRLDQRGTGFSQRLGWEECLVLARQAGVPVEQTSAVQAMTPASEDDRDALPHVGAANRVCWEQFAAQGLDLNQFGTAAAARDVVEFIKVLGYESFNTVHCREDLQFETVQDAIALTNSLAYPEFVDLKKIRATAAPCPTWPVEAADESVKNAVVSDVPTLILQGAYDRRTPVYMGELAANELAHAKLVLIPQQGHEVWSDAGSCAALIAATFIADPQAPVDLSCLKVRQPHWSLPQGNSE